MVNTKVETYHDLVVWQKSHELTLELYKAKLNKKDYDSLAAKIRDVVVLIPANIAVGFKKRSRNAKLHYYRTALAAAEELSYLLMLSNELGALKNYETLGEALESVEHMLIRLIRSNSQTN
jgi:four helix bundle protein